MSAMASLITSVLTVYSTVCSDQRKHQSSASLAFVCVCVCVCVCVWGGGGGGGGIHRWPGTVTRELFPFDDVIIFPNIYNRHKRTHYHIIQSCYNTVNVPKRWLQAPHMQRIIFLWVRSLKYFLHMPLIGFRRHNLYYIVFKNSLDCNIHLEL